CLLIIRHPPNTTLFPYTTLFRSIISEDQILRIPDAEIGDPIPVKQCRQLRPDLSQFPAVCIHLSLLDLHCKRMSFHDSFLLLSSDRKSTRLNSSHVSISYAVFCL